VLKTVIPASELGGGRVNVVIPASGLGGEDYCCCSRPEARRRVNVSNVLIPGGYTLGVYPGGYPSGVYHGGYPSGGYPSGVYLSVIPGVYLRVIPGVYLRVYSQVCTSGLYPPVCTSGLYPPVYLRFIPSCPQGWLFPPAQGWLFPPAQVGIPVLHTVGCSHCAHCWVFPLCTLLMVLLLPMGLLRPLGHQQR